jgi:hypothetical protein
MYGWIAQPSEVMAVNGLRMKRALPNALECGNRVAQRGLRNPTTPGSTGEIALLAQGQEERIWCICILPSDSL